MILSEFLNQRFTEDELNQSIYYAGIGSRNLPDEYKRIIQDIAVKLDNKGFILRSGGANGSDKAFEYATNSKNKEIFYANNANDLTREIACHFHPNPNAIRKNQYVWNLLARNTFQIMSRDLKTPVRFVVCYTEDGCNAGNNRTQKTGGTGQALSIATHFNIPIYNVRNKEDVATLMNTI